MPPNKSGEIGCQGLQAATRILLGFLCHFPTS